MRPWAIDRFPKYDRDLNTSSQRGMGILPINAQIDMVLRLLQRRCGVLSIDLQELVRSLTITQLESLGDALLDFDGMADLEAWFKTNS